MEKEEIQKLQVIINILDYDSLKELLRQPTEAVEETLAGAREFLTTLTTSRPSRQMEVELKGLEEIVGLYQIFSSDGKLHPILETLLGKELISDIKRWASSHPSPERIDIPDRSDNELKQMLTSKRESGEVELLTKEFEVKRLKNGLGHSHLVVITDPAIEDIHIGTVVIVPYADGFKDPIKVLLQTDTKGIPKIANEKFGIVTKYIYE